MNTGRILPLRCLAFINVTTFLVEFYQTVHARALCAHVHVCFKKGRYCVHVCMRVSKKEGIACMCVSKKEGIACMCVRVHVCFKKGRYCVHVCARACVFQKRKVLRAFV